MQGVVFPGFLMRNEQRHQRDVIAGRQPVLEALRAGRPINRIVLARDIGRHSVVAEILHLGRERRIPVEYAPKEMVAEVAGGTAHQGVVAYVAAKDYVSLDDLIGISAARTTPALYVVLDGIEDPQNLGAILRSADAAGVHGVVIRARRAVGLTAAVSRASAGAVEYVPVARVTNISNTLEALKENGLWVVGIDAAGDVRYTETDLCVPTAIVIGSEGKGMSDLVRRRCDIVASIPMSGHVSSLNASVACALVMYEAFRQRDWQK
ncbi:MAG: 23S rRNA (guanosine(2251)-2'-O)-methyltransferase RlmB [Chloroflexota bacterium]